MTRTQQEIFDLAWNGLKAQGFEQSRGTGMRCAYRGLEGRKCAIGHCIPDDRYHPRMEGKSPHNELVSKALGIKSNDDKWFASRLQSCHDDADVPERMEANLRAFAERNALTIPA